MDKIKVLVVEDDKSTLDTLVEALREDVTQADRRSTVVDVIGVRSRTRAIEEAKKGGFAYCIADLEIPELEDGEVDADDEGNYRGLDVIREAAKYNKYAKLYVVSAYSDSRDGRGEDEFSAKRKAIADDGIRVSAYYDKNNDTKYLHTLKREIACPDGLMAAIGVLGLRIVHLAEYFLARALWRQAIITPDSWAHVPIITLMGDTGSGKDYWARVFSLFRENRPGAPKGIKQTPGPLLLSALGNAAAGDSARGDLFGVYAYPHMTRRPSRFVEATAYGIDGINPEWPKCGVAIMSELGRLQGWQQNMFLALLETNSDRGGQITPLGGTTPVKIGCPIVFTTNARIEDKTAESHDAGEGEFPEDLVRRLRAKEGCWLRVPSVSDMGYEVFERHLRLALQAQHAAPVEISPHAIEYMRSRFTDDPHVVTMASIDSIVRTFTTSQDQRLHLIHTDQAFAPRHVRRPAMAVGGNHAGLVPLQLADIGEVIKKGTKKYAALQCIVGDQAPIQNWSISVVALIEMLNGSELFNDVRPQWRGRKPSSLKNIFRLLDLIKIDIKKYPSLDGRIELLFSKTKSDVSIKVKW